MESGTENAATTTQNESLVSDAGAQAITSEVSSAETETLTKSTEEISLENEEAPNLGDMEGRKATDGYVYMDKVKDILSVAMTTGKNVILYGLGGHGKSEFTLDFMREAGIEPYVITMGTGMTTDRMFGGLNIPTFNATGKIEYLIENSFMHHEYVIFEELFDAPDFILEQLKDILSSGIFRNGTQIFEIKTKLIICCTNKTREEFSKNNSLKALMERFPLESKVEWKDYNKVTYENLFKTKLGHADPMLSYILEQYAVAGLKISPRIAIVAHEILDTCGPEALSHIADLNAKPEILKSAVAKFNSLIEVSKLVDQMKELTEKINACPLDTLESVKEAGTLNKELYTCLTKMKAIKADDSIVTTTAEAVKTYTGVFENIKKKLAIIMTVDGEQL